MGKSCPPRRGCECKGPRSKPGGRIEEELGAREAEAVGAKESRREAFQRRGGIEEHQIFEGLWLNTQRCDMICPRVLRKYRENFRTDAHQPVMVVASRKGKKSMGQAGKCERELLCLIFCDLFRFLVLLHTNCIFQ